MAQTLPQARPAPGTLTRRRRVDCSACIVRGMAVCAVLDDSEIADLEAIAAHVYLEADRILFFEADPIEHVFNVKSGALRVSKQLADGRRQITGFLFQGDFLGLGSARGYSYTAEAVTPVTLCRFAWRDLNAVFNKYPKLEKRLFSMAVDELAAAQEQLLLLGCKSARERVASFLLRLSERAQRRGQPASPIQLPMTRGDIADYLGLTTETVSRTFSRFKREGTLAVPHPRRVALLRPDTLRDIADGDNDGNP